MPVSVTRRTVLQKVRGRTYKVLPQLVDTGFQVLFHSPPGVLFTFPSVSGLLTLTLALLRHGFPKAPHLKCLTLPVSVTRRTVLQKVRGGTYKVLPPVVDTGIQFLFHSPPGVLFTFPSQYYALSVTM